MSENKPATMSSEGKLREYIPEFRFFTLPSGAVWRIVHLHAGWSIEPHRSFSRWDWTLMGCVTTVLLGVLAVLAWGIAPSMNTSPSLVLAIGSVPAFIGLVAIWAAKYQTTYAQKATPDLIRWQRGSDRIELPRLGINVEIGRLLAIEIASVSQMGDGDSTTSRHLVLHLLNVEGQPSLCLVGKGEPGLTRVGKFIGRELGIPVIRSRLVAQRS